VQSQVLTPVFDGYSRLGLLLAALYDLTFLNTPDLNRG
jgi:hypothetical protein